MNILKKSSLLLFMLTMLSSCVEKVTPIEYLDVNANNISGTWKLIQWNETTMNESTYMYVDFVRNDRTFTIWQNVDSFSDVPHIITGSFYIETDVEHGAIIRGNYDNDSGDWAHRYIVKELTATSMKWIAKDVPDFIQVFERIDSIPLKK